ncbi:TetR family transcriptional regulator [Streptomyces sp. A 4/2]|uniref:TetR family transcriptional regulator n=1 Tax=Streptomyces sp. A 4/2 TaxID=2934314 RepID=UPI0020244740|nr:TetR family transcriptional regulator [Streptomyces sp. A 4/2]
MPRVAAGRAAVEPSSVEQRARHIRILDAAEELATEKDLDRVQMHEVAKRAGVAIGTLYRYFPSKIHLFVGVMAHQVDRMSEGIARRPRGKADAAERVFDVLVRANRSLLSKPALAKAMIQSSNAANAAVVTDVARIDATFRDVLLAAAGVDRPTADDLAVVRLLLQVWFGILQSSLNGRISMPDAEADLRLACTLLLRGVSPGGHASG